VPPLDVGEDQRHPVASAGSGSATPGWPSAVVVAAEQPGRGRGRRQLGGDQRLRAVQSGAPVVLRRGRSRRIGRRPRRPGRRGSPPPRPGPGRAGPSSGSGGSSRSSPVHPAARSGQGNPITAPCRRVGCGRRLHELARNLLRCAADPRPGGFRPGRPFGRQGRLTATQGVPTGAAGNRRRTPLGRSDG
jgi:hypothetical protein